jgi:hypothetical protein
MNKIVFNLNDGTTQSSSLCRNSLNKLAEIGLSKFLDAWRNWLKVNYPEYFKKLTSIQVIER